MTDHLEAIIIGWIEIVPLELFTFVASFIEEVIAPIPSAGVLLVTGSFAAVQGRPVFDLVPLILIAALGKTLGAIIVYYFSDYFSRLVFGRLGGLLRVSDAEITEIGKRITGTPRDYLILTLCRALPIVPSSAVSVGCGVLKIPLQMFLSTTIVGTIVRDSFFIYAGYTGAAVFTDVLTQSVAIESYIQIAIVAIIGTVFGVLYYRRTYVAQTTRE